MSIETRPSASDELDPECREWQLTPEQLAEIVKNAKPFHFEEWRRMAPPATPEELAETEEFLRERQAERAASKARDAGL